jgi:hypothetical protein
MTMEHIDFQPGISQGKTVIGPTVRAGCSRLPDPRPVQLSRPIVALPPVAVNDVFPFFASHSTSHYM